MSDTDELTELLRQLAEVERDIQAYNKTVAAAQCKLWTLHVERRDLEAKAKPLAIEAAMIADGS